MDVRLPDQKTVLPAAIVLKALTGRIMAGILHFFKVILAVLGIISSYPEVKIDNLFVYRNFKDPTLINAQFSASELINQPVREIIESGVDVNIIYLIKTTSKKHTVYQGSFGRKISYTNGQFMVDHRGGYDFETLTNVISVSELLILSNSEIYQDKPLTTEIAVLINCDATPEIINLWGNKPKVTMTYNIAGKL